jgi:hypothetical protein
VSLLGLLITSSMGSIQLVKITAGLPSFFH